ncbi:hypothetical protein FB567DRAFT_137441 [Paraphoma chrysanthemicola]|uniref:Uncharacterized protein n=1 Tax=Paraphoma chrysanthemicola TaxID=798071 RepID=A0A8K0VV02_9PLEO|nr:hypothetical protein FB567DRAFT_137441 [Paraphoma chrysanthemicola]
MQPSNFLLALLSATATLAAPMDTRLEDIQCRCLSYSTDAKPTLCTYMESHNLDWHTASSLASDYDLKIQFASENTITRVLAINRPLPSSVLQSVSVGQVEPVEFSDSVQRENRIVCGLGDEVKHMGNHDRTLEPECHYIGYMGAAFMSLIVLYLLAEYIWSRFARGSIKLEGAEKALMAEPEGTVAQDQHEEGAPADYS